MISFILLASILTIIVLGVLLRPLIKSRETESYERPLQNIHFAKERLQELQEQLENGQITAAAYQELKLEVESTLAQDIDLDQGNCQQTRSGLRSSNGFIVAVLCCTIPLAALLLYRITSTPEALDLTAATATPGSATSDSPTGITSANIEPMLQLLQQHLQDEPNDLEGWAILARSYQSLGRHQDSIRANITRLELGEENADIYVALADASAVLAGGSLTGQPNHYLQQALALDPDHPQALWLAGLAAAQLKDGAVARKYWDRLMPMLADDQQRELQAIIQQSKQADTAPLLSADANEGAATSLKNNSTALNLKVSLSPSVSQQVQESDLVFVFARAKQGAKVPLAVKQLHVRDLPITLRLDDSDAMLPQFSLSSFDEVVVSARIAKSGNPIAQPGDIQSALIQSNSRTSDIIELIISRVIE